MADWVNIRNDLQNFKSDKPTNTKETREEIAHGIKVQRKM